MVRNALTSFRRLVQVKSRLDHSSFQYNFIPYFPGREVCGLGIGVGTSVRPLGTHCFKFRLLHQLALNFDKLDRFGLVLVQKMIHVCIILFYYRVHYLVADG